MTKSEAIIELIAEGRLTRSLSNAAALRVAKACKALELSDEERIRIFCFLDFCDKEGNLFPSLNNRVKRIW